MMQTSGSKAISFASNSQEFGGLALGGGGAVELGAEEAVHGAEIEQTKLKDQIQSAITDLECEIGQDFKENIPANVTSPTPLHNTHNQEVFSPTPPSKHEYFSPPPLEPVFTQQQQQHQQFSTTSSSSYSTTAESSQQKLVSSSAPERNAQFAAEPATMAQVPAAVQMMQNGFSEHSRNMEMNQMMSQSSMTSNSVTSNQVNGTVAEANNNSLQQDHSTNSSSSSLLAKIMTPAAPSGESDTNSLKRRDPRRMFTDSSFYNAKHHPTVADQVEMAHKLSSALFQQENNQSKGQQMYLNRAKKSGDIGDVDEVDDAPRHDAVPNLKLVMNPEGKVHEWGDLDPSELPDAALMASHAVPSLPSPDVANPVVEDLNSNAGRGGELFAKRRTRADNWVVDESSIGQTKPSAFADKFVAEQLHQQEQFHQQQAAEQSVRVQEQQQLLALEQAQLSQEKQLAQQQFRQQQQARQEQSAQFRHQQQLQQQQLQQQQETMFNEKDIELPPNFKHTSLKGRSFTPSLDLGIHNVQGINVWANSAPRGWKAQKGGAQPAPPTLSVCPATPSAELTAASSHQQQQMTVSSSSSTTTSSSCVIQQQQQTSISQQQVVAEQQQQQEEQQRLAQEEQHRLAEEQQRIEQQRFAEEQERLEQQRIAEEQQRLAEEQQRIEQQRVAEEQQRMEQQRIMEEQQRMEQQRMEQQRMEQQRMEQQRQQQMMMEQQRVEEERRLAGMELSQMSQMSSSTVKQQSFSSSQTTEVFEGTQFEGGVLKGYKKKDEEMNGAAFEQQAAGSSHEKFMKDTGIFGGITGDHNSLVEDDVQFDYKKHTVRDLVGHFSKVKPKAEIPVQYLPEQKLYNGEQGPSLNYLSTKSESSCSTQSTMVKTTSLAKQDLDASKKEYEMRKQQGTSQIDSGAASSVTSAGHTQQQMASSTSEMSLEQQQQLSQRRQSLKEYLLIEPSSLSSANAGLLDPSAILRGSGEEEGRSRSEGLLTQANIQGEGEALSGKWDNHNTIARGWAGTKANYHPVTFRSIYNVDSQKPIAN